MPCSRQALSAHLRVRRQIRAWGPASHASMDASCARVVQRSRMNELLLACAGELVVRPRARVAPHAQVFLCARARVASSPHARVTMYAWVLCARSGGLLHVPTREGWFVHPCSAGGFALSASRVVPCPCATAVSHSWVV